MKHYHSLAQLCFPPHFSLFMQWPLTSAAILYMQQHICYYGLYEVLWLLWMLIVYCILHPFLFTDKPCKACLVMNVSIINRTCNSFRKLSNKRLLAFNYTFFCIKLLHHQWQSHFILWKKDYSGPLWPSMLIKSLWLRYLKMEFYS